MLDIEWSQSHTYADTPARPSVIMSIKMEFNVRSYTLTLTHRDESRVLHTLMAMAYMVWCDCDVSHESLLHSIKYVLWQNDDERWNIRSSFGLEHSTLSFAWNATVSHFSCVSEIWCSKVSCHIRHTHKWIIISNNSSNSSSNSNWH